MTQIHNSNAIWAAIKNLISKDYGYLDDVEGLADHFITEDCGGYGSTEAGVQMGQKAAEANGLVYSITINEAETTYYFVGEEQDIADKIRNLEDKDE